MSFSLYFALGFAMVISILVFGLRKTKKALIISLSIILALFIIGLVIFANSLSNM